jgi:hypothetical protein
MWGRLIYHKIGASHRLLETHIFQALFLTNGNTTDFSRRALLHTSNVATELNDTIRFGSPTSTRGNFCIPQFILVRLFLSPYGGETILYFYQNCNPSTKYILTRGRAVSCHLILG